MHRHHHFFGRDREQRGRHPWGGHMRAHLAGHLGRHRGGRVGRFLEHGDLRFIVLALIAEQPRHGYELIKELEDRTGGAYRPSPGVIYPTLSLLEDEGLIQAAAGETARKLFEPTEAGRAARADWIETVREVLAPRFTDLTDDEWSAVFTTAALLAERTSDISIGAE